MNLDVSTSSHLFADEHGLSAGSFLYYHDSNNVRKEAGAVFEANPKRLYAMVNI